MEDNQQRELAGALEALERQKNIKKEEILKTIEDALVSALRKHLGKSAQIIAKMDPDTGAMKAFQVLKAVDTVVNPETEITLAAAQKLKADVVVGEDIQIKLDITEYSRIAAQIAKQVLIQKIRDIERENLYREFKPREGEVITGSVVRFADKDIIVDLGKAEAILPYSEQIKKERYTLNSRVKAVILRVVNTKDLERNDDPAIIKYKSVLMRMDKAQRGPHIILSRAAGIFLNKLFEVEVPELGERLVEMVTVERDPGFRAKVLVRSKDMKIDPVGACVGMRGMRIRAVMNELSGERIDLIQWTNDTQQLLSNAMSPARVTSVRFVDKEAKRALIIVPDDQLAVAIGKDWQNIRLASKITGWELEVKSEGQVRQEGLKAQEAATLDLTQIDGIGPKIAEVLIKAGMTDIAKIAALTPEYLSTYQGVGEKTAVKIIQGAKKYLEEKQNAAQSVTAEKAVPAVEAGAAEVTNDDAETDKANPQNS